jgi:hypothetical protein
MPLLSVKNRTNPYQNETDKIMLYMDYAAYSGGSDISIYIDRNLKKYTYKSLSGIYFSNIDYNNNSLPLTGWTLSGNVGSIISIDTDIISGDWTIINGEGYRNDVKKMTFSSSNFLSNLSTYPIPVGKVKYSDYLNNYENQKIVKIFAYNDSYQSNLVNYNFAAIRADGSAFIS